MKEFAKKYSTALLLLASAIIAIASYSYRDLFPFDDTFITFRYAENLAKGHGIVWNVGGVHTEGYTNFLFVVLLAICSRLNFDLLSSAQAISLCATAVSSVALFQIIRNAVRRSGTPDEIWPAYLGASLFLLDPFIWYNAWSAMETSLFMMLVLLTIRSLDAWRNDGRTPRTYLTSFLLATLATLTRPEGAVLGMIILAVTILWDRANLRAVLQAFALAFVLPLALYALWKYFYFGNLLPNSFYVKVGQPQLHGGNPLHGWSDEKPFLITVVYLLQFSVPLIARSKNAVAQFRISLAVNATSFWVFLLILFYLFPEQMQPNFFRFLITIKVGLFILASLGIFVLSGYPKNSTLAQVAIILLCHFYSILRIANAHAYITRDTTFDHRYERIASILRQVPNHEKLTLAWGDAGKLPFFSGMKNIDVVGLNDNAIAHASNADSVLRYIFHSRPELIFIPTDSTGYVIRWGHGLIGHAYPQFADSAIAKGYKSIAQFPQSVYRLVLLVDTTIPQYHDIRESIASRIGQDPLVLAPPLALR